uniref:AN1-type domain-containing protein n=1 Tax=Parascaris univalens TaxID=6257 RepID=A0A915AXT8_PARUN
ELRSENMAEFPHLGKNCSLNACNRLDYTPFLCPSCQRYYCGDHRFSHGCSWESECGGTTSGIPSSSSTPIRPFLCAVEDCHRREIVRIECPNCKLNFCLKHRYANEHNCKYLSENGEREHREARWAEIQKKITASQTQEPSKEVTHEVKPKKVLNEVEQRRADRIAVMKLKSKIKIPIDDQIFLIVLNGDERVPIMVSKGIIAALSIMSTIPAVDSGQMCGQNGQ